MLLYYTFLTLSCPKKVLQLQSISDRACPDGVALNLTLIGGKRRLHPNCGEDKQMSLKHLPVQSHYFNIRASLTEHAVSLGHK